MASEASTTAASTMNNRLQVDFVHSVDGKRERDKKKNALKNLRISIDVFVLRTLAHSDTDDRVRVCCFKGAQNEMKQHHTGRPLNLLKRNM